MAKSKRTRNVAGATLSKTPTGIKGFDEITEGGLPTGRPTLVCGAAGAGKTLFGIGFIVQGAVRYNEPGVIISFEEKPDELETNVSSLGFDLKKLQKDKMIFIDHVHVQRNEIEETGEYDLDGLFIRLQHAIQTVGAKRVMLDTIENLFGGLTNDGILRAELRRLFNWLKQIGVTTVITAEKGNGSLTRQGLEEYVSDCVILLDHRVSNQISTRRLRIVKYRGSVHGTNEYPFLIDEDGISVVPITSLKLESKASTQRISSGMDDLDKMLSGNGFYRGSSILVSGTAGTGKTSIAATFADAACRRNERCLFFAFEESPQQIIRNMRSIGMDLQEHVDRGLLIFSASRPTLFGLEMHLALIHKKVEEHNPKVVVVDPISNLIASGILDDVKFFLIRLLDFLQSKGITVLFTALNLNSIVTEQRDEGVSSLVDAWITVKEIESNGERNKGLFIMKSRGMGHSNSVREFVISNSGLHLIDVFVGPEGVLTGSARESQQLLNETGIEMRGYALTRNNKLIDRKRKVLESKIAALNEEFDSVRDEMNRVYMEEDLRKDVLEKARKKLTQKKDGDGKSK